MNFTLIGLLKIICSAEAQISVSKEAEMLEGFRIRNLRCLECDEQLKTNRAIIYRPSGTDQNEFKDIYLHLCPTKECPNYVPFSSHVVGLRIKHSNSETEGLSISTDRVLLLRNRLVEGLGIDDDK